MLGNTPDSDPSTVLGRVKFGVDFTVEEMANNILRDARKNITALSEKQDYLTEEQLSLRQSREVPNSNGFPEAHIISGLYRRCYNPLAGQRPTKRRVEEG